MSRKLIAISFALLFTAYLSAPLILSAMNETVDVSAFYGWENEEENEKGEEKTIELLILNQVEMSRGSYLSLLGQKVDYEIKTYQNPHLKFHSPPPERNILA